MAFNARWAFEDLATALGLEPEEALQALRSDLVVATDLGTVYRLGISPGGTHFRLADGHGGAITPSAQPGLYAIFDLAGVRYVGKAGVGLARRLLSDPDQTADSTKRLNDGRPAIKRMLGKDWLSAFGLGPFLCQEYPVDLALRDGTPFGDRWLLSEYLGAVEALLRLAASDLHSHMCQAARSQGLLDYNVPQPS